jgi:hypothetical protein
MVIFFHVFYISPYVNNPLLNAVLYELMTASLNKSQSTNK